MVMGLNHSIRKRNGMEWTNPKRNFGSGQPRWKWNALHHISAMVYYVQSAGYCATCVPVSHGNRTDDTCHAELNRIMRIDGLGPLTLQKVVEMLRKMVDLDHDLLLHDVLSKPEISKDMQRESSLFSPKFAYKICYFVSFWVVVWYHIVRHIT